LDMNSIEQNSLYFNRIKFNPFKFNCIIDCNKNGVLELISVQNIKLNDEIICWFSEIYITKIKSKDFLKLIVILLILLYSRIL
jgi:hypothetical protein